MGKSWILLTVFFTALLLHAAPVNKTKYKIPGKGENLHKLTLAAKQTRGEKDPVCLSFHVTVTLEKDHSGRIDHIEKYYLPTAVKTPLRKDYTNTFVELILPDGSYRAYHSPRRVPGIAGTLVYVKYTKNLPPRDTLSFLLDLPLNLHCRVKETHVKIFHVKFEKLFHSILPPPEGKSISIRKLGRSAYILGETFPVKEGAQPYLLRLSLHPDWNTFAVRYFEKHLAVKELPAPLLKRALELKKQEKLSAGEKLRLLAVLLPGNGKGTGKEETLSAIRLLVAAGQKAGVEIYPFLASAPPLINPAVAGDIFSHIFLIFRQGEKEILQEFSNGKLQEIPEKFHNGSMLILRGYFCQLRKIPPPCGRKLPR